MDVWKGKDCYRCHYALDWKKLPFNTFSDIEYIGEIDKPVQFDEMKQIAETLSENHPFVRVDLYSIEGKTLFGELTFYPSDTRKDFLPSNYNELFGSYITLPKIPVGQKEITQI